MSLEDALKASTAAMEAMTAAVEKNTALLAGALSAKQNAGSASGKTMTAAEAEKVQNANAVKGDAAAGTKPGRGGGKKADADKGPPSIDVLREKAGAFLSVKDKAEKESRKEFIGEINSRFGVERVTEIPEDNRAQALEWIKARTEDADFELPAPDGDSEDDNGGSLI